LSTIYSLRHRKAAGKVYLGVGVTGVLEKDSKLTIAPVRRAPFDSPQPSNLSYLERVLVQHVEGIPRELDTTAAVALDQISILVACRESIELAAMINPGFVTAICWMSLGLPLRGKSSSHTGELPDEVAGNV
jgi:hypothetical protein